MSVDVIDGLAGIAAGSALDAVRRQRMDARTHAQVSFDALFTPVAAGGFSVRERHAVAAFVAGLHNQPDAAAFYGAALAQDDTAFYGAALAQDDTALAEAVRAEAGRGAAKGPFGAYPAGPHSGEDSAGPVHHADAKALGEKLAAGLDHAHMLLFHPRDAAPEWLQRLVDAGWDTPAIVTLSQLVAFLSFQIRVVAGYRAMTATAP